MILSGNVISEKKISLDIQDIDKAKKIFEYLGFNELVEVKYHVVVYEKDGIEFAFQVVEDLGTLIEYENKSDFEGKTLDEINSVKKKMFEEIKNTGIKISNEIDVKKTYELIKRNLKETTVIKDNSTMQS